MQNQLSKDQQRITFSLITAGIWVILLVAIFLFEGIFEKALDIDHRTWVRTWGILPHHIPGIWKIFTSAFIHGGVEHLLSNIISLFFLAAGLFYFYRKISWQVLLLLLIGSGLGTWVFGRSSIHIGASGVIYGIAFFLFFSGVFRKEAYAMALSLVVVMFHGSMVWGMIPFFTDESISWEGHLFGAISGVATAFLYRKKATGPGKKYDWENEPDPTGEEWDHWNYKKTTPPPSGFQHPE